MATVLSSDPEMMRNGRVGLKSTLFMTRACPVRFPLEVPVSKRNTCPKRSFPSPTAAILLLSLSQAMSLTGPENTGIVVFRIWVV